MFGSCRDFVRSCGSDTSAGACLGQGLCAKDCWKILRELFVAAMDENIRI